MATLLPEGKQSFNNSAGAPLVGGKVYTYDAGTNTPRTTYSDAAATVPNTNPVVLDARGEATIFWAGAYKVILKDAADVTIWTVDNITSADIVDIGLQPKFSASVATSIGGYPVGYVLQDNAGLNSYVNIVAANTTDFNTTPASIGVSWIPYAGQRATQAGTNSSAPAAGTVNAITAAFSPAVIALLDGMCLRFRPTGANSVTNPTFSPNGLTAKTIVKGANSPLVSGDIAGAGGWAQIQYDLTLDKWVLLNPATPAIGSGLIFSGITGYSANTTLTTGNYGNFIYVNGTFTLTLPVADASNIGKTITCYGYAAASVTVATQSSQLLYYQGTNTATSAVTIGVGDTVTFVNYNGTAWMAMGANALGTGQTYSNVTGSRVLGTTYTNTTGKPIFVIGCITFGAGAGAYNFNVAGSAVGTITGSQANGALPTIGGIVPTGASYSISFASGTAGTLTSWTELR
ncbi:hypothetical protein P26218_26 [Rhodoferax phage P26218]|uniref:hypothetical protein n=1 Tax=Rhodoferax phage P26218 TaxID=1636270 RepID=UPI0005FEB5BC|nr:hypothetical protein AXJ08_gp26 [Rhodoferax phage P26218]AKA60329.1 hypothetical protein P26218_26 [Rhodoferax phage P26218]